MLRRSARDFYHRLLSRVLCALRPRLDRSTMSWWGGKKPEKPMEKTDAAPGGFDEKTDFQGGGSSFGGSNFAAGPSSGGASAPKPSGAIAAAQRQQMAQQEMMQQLQQQQMVQEGETLPRHPTRPTPWRLSTLAQLQPPSSPIRRRHHQVLNKLTEAAFDKCINKPESGLGSSEKQCINATVQKWLDTTQFVQGRFQRKAQAAQEQQQLN
mmetsp:Transcript_82655/g.233647  ORF Transcript_82655/g.233647 Transcript_82655/m.233647 type:complete len:210 (-) Transcript_82655:416-1045(-)